MTPAEVAAARAEEELDELPDPEAAALEKCKPGAHLRTIVEAGTGHGDADQSVRYIAELACRNAQEGPKPPTWGALIDPTGKAVGMHLFPDAVALLAHQLPITADEARAAGPGHMVSLQHTVVKTFKTWRSFTPDEADAIALDLSVLHA